MSHERCRCNERSTDKRDWLTFIVQYVPSPALTQTTDLHILPCRSVKKKYTGKVESCLPLHLNLSSRIESIFRFCALFGISHLAPDVSIGCAWRYALNQRRLQSQMNGFLAKCLRERKRAWLVRRQLEPRRGRYFHSSSILRQTSFSPRISNARTVKKYLGIRLTLMTRTAF